MRRLSATVPSARVIGPVSVMTSSVSTPNMPHSSRRNSISAAPSSSAPAQARAKSGSRRRRSCAVWADIWAARAAARTFSVARSVSRNSPRRCAVHPSRRALRARPARDAPPDAFPAWFTRSFALSLAPSSIPPLADPLALSLAPSWIGPSSSAAPRIPRPSAGQAQRTRKGPAPQDQPFSAAATGDSQFPTVQGCAISA